MRLLSFCVSLALTAIASASAPVSEDRTPVLVELFTSQGCSSCPPADAFIEALAKRRDVIALTRPVTYWDRLGWKDTLAREENTALQNAYAGRGGEGSGVYTPQTMVQGRFATVGSRRDMVARQIQAARSQIGAAIAVRPGLIAIDGKGGHAEVRLLHIKSAEVVRIGSGENGGRTVRYSNIVVGERVIGQWTGGAQTFVVPAGTLRGADRRVVIVQAANAGPVLAAAWL